MEDFFKQKIISLPLQKEYTCIDEILADYEPVFRGFGSSLVANVVDGPELSKDYESVFESHIKNSKSLIVSASVQDRDLFAFEFIMFDSPYLFHSFERKLQELLQVVAERANF